MIDLVNSLQTPLSNSHHKQLKGASEEDLYKILAHSSQVGFYIMQNKRFQFINSHFREYTGYTEDKMLKMNPVFAHPAGRPAQDGQKRDHDAQGTALFTL